MTVEPPPGERDRVDPSPVPPVVPPSSPGPPGRLRDAVPVPGALPPQYPPEASWQPAGAVTSPGAEAPPGYGAPWDPIGATGPPARRTTNGMAIASLVVGIIGGAGVSAALGVIALLQIRRTAQRGRALAVIGILLSMWWVAVVSVLIVITLRLTPARGADGQVTRRTSLPVTRLRVGDCVEGWAAVGQVGTVTVVPCAAAHDAQVFFTYTVPGTSFPGDPQVTAAATTACVAGARAALMPDELPTTSVAYLKPLATSWSQGDRTVICVAVSKTSLARSILR